MDSLLTQLIHRQSARYRSLARYKRWSLIAVGLLLILSVSTFAFKPSPPPDLAVESNLLSSGFYAHWTQGDLVVLLRHVERCDHSTNPCLGPLDGITTKGQKVAQDMGKSISALGLAQTDIYNSPMLRTEQTASFAFNKTTPGQEWLIDCRKSMLNDVLAHKLDNRNLVLVTHSECISALEKTLKVAAPTSMEYGASLILSIDPKSHSATVLGYIDARSWATIVAKHP